MVLLRERLRSWARALKRDGLTLWFAVRHAGTPWYAKALAVAVVAYALSPIDLIPDFIPVLGFLDDVILLPALIWVTLRLIPAPVLQACRGEADAWIAAGRGRPRSVAGAVVIGTVWVLAVSAAGVYLMRFFGH